MPARLRVIVLTLALIGQGAAGAHAVEIGPAQIAAPVKAEMARGFKAVGPSTTEEPALRAERQTQDPSAGFLLGAALGAWVAAAGQLDFDLKNPQAAGPPHVSQTGGDEDAILMECADETVAFDHLESRRKAMDATPQQVIAAANAPAKDPYGADILGAWHARMAGPAKGCR
jgi:hypothetical protein